MTTVYDVLIIGAGPAGLACGLEAQTLGLHCLIIDKGTLCDNIRRFPVSMEFYSTAELLEIGGVPFTNPNPKPTRIEVLEYYRRVTQAAKLPVYNNTLVEEVRKEDGGDFAIQTSRGEFRARTVILATGYFDTTNKLQCDGEDLPHVHRYYTEAYAYVGSTVVVVGGRNSAVETALDLWRHGARVHVVHRGESLSPSVKYWLKPDMENRIKSGEITASFSSRITSIRPKELDIEHTETGVRQTLQADYVLPLIGYRPDASLFRRCGISFDSETLVCHINPNTHESSVRGLYVAGSVLCGCKVWNIFIENGREHAKPILADIVAKLR